MTDDMFTNPGTYTVYTAQPVIEKCVCEYVAVALHPSDRTSKITGVVTLTVQDAIPLAELKQAMISAAAATATEKGRGQILEMKLLSWKITGVEDQDEAE